MNEPPWNYMYISSVRKPHGTNQQDIWKSRKTWIVMQKYRQTNYIRRIHTLRLFLTWYSYEKYYQNNAQMDKIENRIRSCLTHLMAGVTQRDQAERTRSQPQIQPIEGTGISSSCKPNNRCYKVDTSVYMIYIYLFCQVYYSVIGQTMIIRLCCEEWESAVVVVVVMMVVMVVRVRVRVRVCVRVCVCGGRGVALGTLFRPWAIFRCHR